MSIRNPTRHGALIVSVIIGLFGPLAHRRQLPDASTVAFVSTRHSPAADPWTATEIYLMSGDGSGVKRVTENNWADGFPSLSPDGTKIVFDSNRLRASTDPVNTSDLFLMKVDGTDAMHIVRGSSATWSPDGKSIAFHASASGAGRPIKIDPGAATSDSDIFVVTVSGLQRTATPKNITHNPAAIDDDPDWSPDGTTIVFTSHATIDDPMNATTTEVYVANADGTGVPKRLTNNSEEERAPAWSPDGKRILFQCRQGPAPAGRAVATFELCVMNADGSGLVRLTTNALPELTPSWSPDGRQIVFHRPVGGSAQFQLFMINSDGSGEKQVTFPPGNNAFANWAR